MPQLPVPDDRPVAIDARALSKLFGATKALLDVTFSVHPGELVAVIGDRGSGKSTLLRLLAAHVTPSGGRVRVAGIDARTSRLELMSRVGYVAQRPASWGNMTVRDVLEFGGRARRLPAESLDSRIGQLADACDLLRLLDASCRSLDSAEHARLSLTLALLHEPAVLLLDEYLTGLEPADVRGAVGVLTRLKGSTTMLVSGPASIATHLDADRVLGLAHGRLDDNGSTGTGR